MDPISYLTAALGFVVVAGYVGLVWLRRDRAPRVTDDSSILLAEPPEGLTAATAAVVDHQGTATAFLAALLDLASRDEIRFRAEADRQLVGIELRGGDSTDPRVRLNRRRPVGEGEAWLLVQLKEASLAGANAGTAAARGAVDPTTTLGGLGPMVSFLGFAASEQGDDDSPEARARREHGLLDGPPLDPQALAAAIERGSGRPLSDQQQAAFAKLGLLTQALESRASIAADPDAFAAQIAATTGQPMSPADLAAMKAWAAHVAQGSPPSMPVAPGSTSGSTITTQTDAPAYIAGESALRLGAPLFFASLIESYARRHGWLGGLSFLGRLRWHLIGAGELVAALLMLAIGSSLRLQALTALGLGVGLGGMVTFLVAPAMLRVTAEGALVRAQIAAYRRTLELTFAAAGSIGDAVGLAWLETPDQLVVWGIALGLREDVETLLAKSSTPGVTASLSYLPTWYATSSAVAAPGATAMFSEIAAIGSKPGPTPAAGAS